MRAVDIPVQISIENTPTAYVIESDRSTPLTLTAFTEPVMKPRIRYATDATDRHGAVALGWAWEQTFLTFSVAARDAASETSARAAIATLRALLARLRYTVTTQIDTSPAEAWLCDPGSLTPAGGRSYADLRHHDPEWTVQIPCYPVRTINP